MTSSSDWICCHTESAISFLFFLGRGGGGGYFRFQLCKWHANELDTCANTPAAGITNQTERKREREREEMERRHFGPDIIFHQPHIEFNDINFNFKRSAIFHPGDKTQNWENYNNIWTAIIIIIGGGEEGGRWEVDSGWGFERDMEIICKWARWNWALSSVEINFPHSIRLVRW